MSKKKKTPKNKSKATNVKTYDLLRVDWKDHFSGNRLWVNSAAELKTDPMICVSVGVLVKEDKETLTLAQNMSQNEQMTDTTTIIKSCIIYRTKVGELTYGPKKG